MIITKVHIQQQQLVVEKFYRAKSYTECYLQPKIGPPSPYQEMVLNVFTLMCSQHMLVTNLQEHKILMT